MVAVTYPPCRSCNPSKGLLQVPLPLKNKSPFTRLKKKQKRLTLIVRHDMTDCLMILNMTCSDIIQCRCTTIYFGLSCYSV